MPLGTLDRTPPPIFRQGPSALTKLVFFAALALFLMVADGRLRLIAPLRSGLAVALLPVQRALAAPVALAASARDYLGGLEAALGSAEDARKRLAAQSGQLARTERLAQENERLRALLALRPEIVARTQAAEILYEAADPFSRKVIVDRGATHEVAAGSPVIDEAGVLGQVTRLYPLTAEVTLSIDKDGAIPVLNTRTQQRSVAFGGLQLPGGGGALELRFLPANADVQVGDAAYPMRLGVPGRHNLLNAAGAVAALSHAVPDTGPGTWVQLLGRFTGVARRFERVGERAGVVVVDDYAHNPAKVAAVVATGRAVVGAGRLVVVFQPHLFTRTRDQAEGFGAALLAADAVFVLPVYPSREQPIPGVTSPLVSDAARSRGHRAVADVDYLAALVPRLAPELRPGDLLVTMGAGDVNRLGEEYLARGEGA